MCDWSSQAERKSAAPTCQGTEPCGIDSTMICGGPTCTRGTRWHDARRARIQVVCLSSCPWTALSHRRGGPSPSRSRTRGEAHQHQKALPTEQAQQREACARARRSPLFAAAALTIVCFIPWQVSASRVHDVIDSSQSLIMMSSGSSGRLVARVPEAQVSVSFRGLNGRAACHIPRAYKRQPFPLFCSLSSWS